VFEENGEQSIILKLSAALKLGAAATTLPPMNGSLAFKSQIKGFVQSDVVKTLEWLLHANDPFRGGVYKLPRSDPTESPQRWPRVPHPDALKERRVGWCLV